MLRLVQKSMFSGTFGLLMVGSLPASSFTETESDGSAVGVEIRETTETIGDKRET